MRNNFNNDQCAMYNIEGFSFIQSRPEIGSMTLLVRHRARLVCGLFSCVGSSRGALSPLLDRGEGRRAVDPRMGRASAWDGPGVESAA